MKQSITSSVALASVIAAREASTSEQIALSAELAHDIAGAMVDGRMSAARGGSYLAIAPRLLRLAFDPSFHRDFVIKEELRRTCAFACFDMDTASDERGCTDKAHFFMLLALAEQSDLREAVDRSIDSIELPREPHPGGTPVLSLNTPAGVAKISRDDAYKPASFMISLETYCGKPATKRQTHASEVSAKHALKALCASHTG